LSPKGGAKGTQGGGDMIRNNEEKSGKEGVRNSWLGKREKGKTNLLVKNANRRGVRGAFRNIQKTNKGKEKVQ